LLHIEIFTFALAQAAPNDTIAGNLMRLRLFCAALTAAALAVPSAHAVVITSGGVVALPGGILPSGNGSLDLRMLTFQGGEVPNTNNSPAFNADNGNNTLPNNNGQSTFAESYFTTIGEIQDYYKLNFPDGMGGSLVNEIVVMLDLAENSGVEETNNQLTLLDVVLSPTVGVLDPSGDLTSGQQAGINQTYTGGTLLANLASTMNLSTVANGQGHGDYAIFTGINPFALNASDTILFNVSMSGLSNGSEEVFLSGRISGADVLAAVPEATSLAFGALVCGVLGIKLGAGKLRARKTA
jgi:hypothetical protein